MKVLVVAAHPDDEVLGCGGTMAKHADRGDDVASLFLADGVGARGPEDDDALTARMAAAADAARLLGCGPSTHMNFADNQLDSVPLLELVKAVERRVEEFGPERIYTHHHGDLNIDHRLTHEAVLTACRPLAGRCVREIYGFEVLSSTEWSGPSEARAFLPNHFENIEDFLDRKLDALAAYEMELAPFPHPRSPEAVRALAALRGANSGFLAAEAFMLVRSLN
jgi:LmbE family N-acetylglucosaminyl deacetylase